MIINFKDKETEKVYRQQFSKKFPQQVQKVALRKLAMLNKVSSIIELSMIGNCHLEKSKGNRLGQYSIRINNQYRICFKLKNNNFYDVEIIDYH